MATEWKSRQYQRYLLDIASLYRERQDLKAYLEILLSIVAVAVFVVFAIKPTFITISDLVTKINTEQATSDALDVKIKNLGIAQGLFDQEQNNINLLNSAVPTGPSVTSYIRQMEGMVQKEGVTPVTFTVNQVDLISKDSSASGESSSAKTINVTVSVTGTYQNLISFLKDIENSRRSSILNKVDLNINASDLQSQQNQAINFITSSLVPYN